MPFFGPPTKGPGTVRIRWCGYVKDGNGLKSGINTTTIKDAKGEKIIVKTPEEAKSTLLANLKQMVDATGNNIFNQKSPYYVKYNIGDVEYLQSTQDPKPYYYLIKLSNYDDDDKCGKFGGKSRKHKQSRRHGKSRRPKKSRKHRKTRRH